MPIYLRLLQPLKPKDASATASLATLQQSSKWCEYQCSLPFTFLSAALGESFCALLASWIPHLALNFIWEGAISGRPHCLINT